MGYSAEKVRPAASRVVDDPEEPVRPILEQAVRRNGDTVSGVSAARVRSVRLEACRIGFLDESGVLSML